MKKKAYRVPLALCALLTAGTASLPEAQGARAAGDRDAQAGARTAVKGVLGDPSSTVDMGGDPFGCDGGPGGDFDWVIKSGETFVLDTATSVIFGGPGGAPSSQQTVTSGRVLLRNLTIEQGGKLRAFGPYPLRICASGEVVIRGTLDVSGYDAKNVATLNTGHQPETGGAGGPSGGRGGGSSSNTTGSTPSGDPGNGILMQGVGGQGGESQFAPANLGKDARRPAGGGGGRFAEDYDASIQGLFAEPGFPGHALGTGAINGVAPAIGGAVGTGPFVDGDPDNDFFGVKAVRDPGGNLLGLVRGELRQLQGGYGGGGGGDAVPSIAFPQSNWNPGSDEKGGAGGGGGGALHIRALGRIVLGHSGTIQATGGEGGSGENTVFLDHVGGSGGAGSGGMIMLESATQVDFTDGDPLNAPVRRILDAKGGPRHTGTKTNGNGEVLPVGVSYGGTGGPGLIQVHVPLVGQTPSFSDPSAMLVLPAAAALAVDPLAEISKPAAHVLLPGVDAR